MPDRPEARADLRRAFDRHYRDVWQAAYRVLGRSDETDDIAQEVFLRLHRRREKGAGEDDTRAWLVRVATNLALNAARSAERRARRNAAAAIDGAADARVGDPGAEAARNGEIADVRRALRALPERDATMLLLRHSGASYRELAEAVGVAPGSVGTMLARAERAFAAAFEDVSPFDADGGDS